MEGQQKGGMEGRLGQLEVWLCSLGFYQCIALLHNNAHGDAAQWTAAC